MTESSFFRHPRRPSAGIHPKAEQRDARYTMSGMTLFSLYPWKGLAGIHREQHPDGCPMEHVGHNGVPKDARDTW